MYGSFYVYRHKDIMYFMYMFYVLCGFKVNENNPRHRNVLVEKVCDEKSIQEKRNSCGKAKTNQVIKAMNI